MLVSRPPVLALGGLLVASALALSGGSAPAPSAVRGPSGQLAISATYAAGQNPAREHEDPVPALPDAGIADLDTVGNQVAYTPRPHSISGTYAEAAKSGARQVNASAAR